MKYAIITPTFEPHFKYIKKYLESYKKYVQDKKEIEIIFTISKDEIKDFYKIIRKFDNINFKILYFEDILKYFNINLSPDFLLKKYEKFTFQTLKKFYTMLYSDADKFLVLDSESMWVKECCMKEVFEEFFNAPFISGSSIPDRRITKKLTQCIIDNTNYLLGQEVDKWFLENFVWFYDKKILNDMFEKHGTPIEMAEKIYQLKDKRHRNSGYFEIELYQAYLYQNLEKYNYKFLNVDELLSNALSIQEFNNYLDNYYKNFNGNCGLLEHSLILLNEQNCEQLANMFKENSFNIIRCDYSILDNITLQEKFINIVKPNILAASQEHAFGVKDKFTTLVIKNKYLIKLEKHLFYLMHPSKFSLQLLIEPFSIIFYFVKWLFLIRKNFKIYKNNL